MNVYIVFIFITQKSTLRDILVIFFFCTLMLVFFQDKFLDMQCLDIVYLYV